MKTLFTSILLLFVLGLSSMAFATSSTGWRLIVSDTIGGDHPVNISEIEWLHDHDDDVNTAKIDGTEADLGIVVCGWTRSVPNLTGNTTPIGVGCDSVSVNRMPNPDITIPTNTRRTRLGKLMFDDSSTTFFETKNKTSPTNTFTVQYKWYVGGSAPGRVLPDITGYSIMILNDYLLDKAPVTWEIQYLSNGGSWTTISEVSEAFFTNGTDVLSGTDVIGKKLTFTLP